MYLIIIATIALIFSYIERKNIIEKKWFYIFLGMLALFFIFRYPVGTDITAYSEIFDELDLVNIKANQYYSRSFLFFMIMYMVRYLNGSFTVVLFIINIINMSLVFYTIYKNSKNISGSLFICLASGVLQIYMSSALRQGMAMCFFFFGYYNFLKNKKRVLYLITSILAILCHETGCITLIVFVVDLLLDKLPIMKNKYFIISLLIPTIILSFFSLDICTYITENYIYSLRFYLNGVKLNIGGIGLRFLLLGIIYSIYLTLNKESREKYNKSIYIYYLITLLYCAFSWVSSFSRIADFFAIIEIIMIPNMIMELNIQDKKIKTLIYLVIILYVTINYAMLIDDLNYTSRYYKYVFDIASYPLSFIFTLLKSSKVPY